MTKFYVSAVLVPRKAEEGQGNKPAEVFLTRYDEHTRNPAEARMRLRDALLLVSPDEDAGTHWAESRPYFEPDWFHYEHRRLVPPANITPASYRRVTRLLERARCEVTS